MNKIKEVAEFLNVSEEYIENLDTETLNKKITKKLFEKYTIDLNESGRGWIFHEKESRTK